MMRAIEKTNAQTWLVALFTASLVAANLLGSKLIDIGGVTISIGIFVFPFTFISADIMTEVYGKKAAQAMVTAGVAVQLYVLLFVELGAMLPDSAARPTGTAYQTMFGLAPRMVWGSIIAYLASQYFEVALFARLKKVFNGRWLLLRTNAAAWLAQLFDTFIFMLVFLGGILDTRAWINSFIIAYLSKMAVATCDSPFVNIGVWLIRRIEERHHDEKNFG